MPLPCTGRAPGWGARSSCAAYRPRCPCPSCPAAQASTSWAQDSHPQDNSSPAVSEHRPPGHAPLLNTSCTATGPTHMLLHALPHRRGFWLGTYPHHPQALGPILLLQSRQVGPGLGTDLAVGGPELHLEQRLSVQRAVGVQKAGGAGRWWWMQSVLRGVELAVASTHAVLVFCAGSAVQCRQAQRWRETTHQHRALGVKDVEWLALDEVQPSCRARTWHPPCWGVQRAVRPAVVGSQGRL